ncbi:MAG: protein translocase subunit SecF [Alphaproteobacteria bacterium]|nr:protein translocase subunit SecF [Alphaproteobacteria bacterium]MBO5441343.1 protein translocase subunit SecF [Alphaproteobacteria bacterium]MBP3687942.1 protein translocase subunit SecF [Alphaproteobacteria bacterium]
MTMLKWITKDTNIDFMKARYFTYALSGILIILSFLSMYFKGFNFGIDFSGGVLMEIKAEQPINVEEIRSKLSVLKLDELNLQTIGEKGDELMIRAQAENADEAAQRKAVVDIKNILGNGYEYRRVENVGPQVGDELKTAGIVASVLAMLAIAIYIWARFEWQFALGALLGLFHDIIITVGLLSYFRFDFSLTTVAAILTLVGYSINDTVVTYDRIRENLKKYRKMPQLELLNKSINDIFSRTILTGVTTLIAVIPLYIWGGEALESFAFTILAGLIIGTYSSIYICTAFLNLFDLRAVEHKDEENYFGTIG